jgi:hypothetical protein
LPAWQRLGVGLYWESYEKVGFNPRIGKNTLATRRRIVTNRNLPIGEDYERFVETLLR